MSTKSLVGSKKSKDKNGNTLIRDLEKEFNVNLGVPGNMKIVTYLKKSGLPVLAKLLDKVTR